MSNSAALYEALRDEPATVKQLAKKLKMEEEETEQYLEDLRIRRLWVTRDDSGKTAKYALTSVARSQLAASAGETSTDGGTTDGSIRFGQYQRSSV